jgi:CubicO group peptidase (beta-lactamase class C family)
MNRKLIKKIIILIIVVFLIYGISFVWPRVPIITAFAAKGMCSSVFLADKEPARIEAEDLSFFPISLAKTKVDYDEKSATSTVFGLAKRKAVYREGKGAVIVLRTPEEELRKSWFKIPDPGYRQDTLPWPKGDLVADSMPAGVNYDRLHELLDTCIDQPGSEPWKKTLGIAVVYENQLIAEKYLHGYDYRTLFHGWSMTKTITGAWAGILADKGLLDPNGPVGIEEWANDKRSKITVKNVIQMSTGLDWYENYFTISDATVMLMTSEDMMASITDNEPVHPAGTNWIYSSGDANLLSGIIRNRLNGDDQYHAGLYRDLLHPAGMLNTKVETDASGLYVASSYSYGTVRDWARFGLLFLNNGIVAGDTILPPWWVEFMKTPAEASNGKYAGTFWLQEPEEQNALTDVPGDIFFADGFLGQRIYIIPSKKLVVVRMGYGLSNFNLNNFLSEIIKTLPE